MRYINTPLVIKLTGGMMDGDTFDLIPNYSMFPPAKLIYRWLDRDTNTMYLLEYSCETNPDWASNTLKYNFIRRTKNDQLS